jgi:putative glutamine amidotransferase
MSADPPGRPVVGISAYSEVARWGLWDMQATLLPQNYADQLVAAGALPVLLPPVRGVERAVTRLDGLIISGGPDIQPDRYGQQAGPRTTIVRPERDEAEIALFRSALAARMPVLGICRGMQLINAALGGTLIQHLPDVVGHEGHSPTPGTMAEHKVTIGGSGSRSLLAEILGEGTHLVPTHHHQGIDRLGRGLVATAWAEDGTVEGLELAGQFVLGVQWHPEAGDDLTLLRALVEAAATAGR